MRKIRVLHFVTGGFSGATLVAIELCRAALPDTEQEAILVLRRKKNTTTDRIQALQQEGLDVYTVARFPHFLTILQLKRYCESLQPDIVVAHGFGEHIWGRIAAWLANVPHLVHVEHNAKERYTPWTLWQARWLAKKSYLCVGVSDGVRQYLLSLGMPPEKTVSIPNGLNLTRHLQVQIPYQERIQGVVMLARFARQKDHETLIRAIAYLKLRGLIIPLKLAGAGKTSWRKRAENLVEALGIRDQVEFMGHVDDVVGLLAKYQVGVLSSHFEGMGLGLVEAMAAGCVGVGSKVPGIEEIITHQEDGFLVPAKDALALANQLQDILANPEAMSKVAEKGRQMVAKRYSQEQMARRYREYWMAAVQ